MTYRLNKTSNDYLNNRLEAVQLHEDNNIDLTLGSGVTAVTTATRPQARTTGNTVVHLVGKLDVGASPGANMTLVTFPSEVLPHNIGDFTVVLEASGGAKSVVPVSMTSTGINAVGTPTANDIYHLDSIVYLSKY